MCKKVQNELDVFLKKDVLIAVKSKNCKKTMQVMVMTLLKLWLQMNHDEMVKHAMNRY